MARSGSAAQRGAAAETDRLPGVTELSCNTILSRIKDIKGLRL